MIINDPMPDIGQKEFLQSIAEGLSWPDTADFDRAIDHLRDVSSSQLRDMFETFLDDPSAQLALGVARAAGHLGCSEAADLLIELIYEPGKWFGHAERAAILLAAVQSLGVLRTPLAADPLLELLGSAHDPELQMETVRAIGKIGSPASVRPLIGEMKANPPLALSAAGALAQIGGEEAFRGLVTGLSLDDEIIRSASVWALGMMADERAIGPLLNLVADDDPFLRRDIAWSLGQIGGLRARITLGALSQADSDLGVRREAVRAIQSGAVLGKFRKTPPDNQ